MSDYLYEVVLALSLVSTIVLTILIPVGYAAGMLAFQSAVIGLMMVISLTMVDIVGAIRHG